MDYYKQANNNINQILNINSTKRNTMKNQSIITTNGQLMRQNFPIGTKLTYQGSKATVTDYSYVLPQL